MFPLAWTVPAPCPARSPHVHHARQAAPRGAPSTRATHPRRPRCKDSDPDLARGKFKYRRILTDNEIQNHVRKWCAAARRSAGQRLLGGAAHTGARASRHSRLSTPLPPPTPTRGAVLTRMDIMSDTKAFFEKTPGGIYTPAKDARTVERHAVLIVGARARGRALTQPAACPWTKRAARERGHGVRPRRPLLNNRRLQQPRAVLGRQELLGR